MRKMLFLLLAIATSATAWSQAQPDYIPEQLGRDAHHIIQSLGAFVGNERAESQSFDITYMPAGNGVEGVMIINTADYRCTFKLDADYEMCYELTIDIRSKEFLDQFYNLFAVYLPLLYLRIDWGLNMVSYRLAHITKSRPNNILTDHISVILNTKE